MTYVFIASPSSGGTFIRTFLQTYYAQGNFECNKAATKFKNIVGCNMIAHHICLATEGVLADDYKVIHLIRNGLDVVNSRITRSHSSDSALERRSIKEMNLVNAEQHVKFAYLWVKDVTTARKMKHHENYLEIRYEDLINDTSNTLTNIENFLGQTNNQSLQYLKDSLVSAIGKYKKLSEEILKDIKPIVKELNKELGYDS